MSEITIKMKAKELGLDIENLAPWIEAELDDAVKNLAHAAHASMVSQIQNQQMDPKNRQDYLRGLKFTELGDDSYLIFLEGDWANKLEEGFEPYNMKDTLLSSKKIIQTGSRAGEPWVRTNKKGKKYAAVPFQFKPFSKDAGSGDLTEDIKSLVAENKAGKEQAITKVFKDLDGNAISGRVASIKDAVNPKLEGLTKYQHVADSGKVSSVYFTFRIISEDSSGWQHPGHSGYNLFKQAEEFVDREMENILTTLLG